jgi:hypothetical protein
MKTDNFIWFFISSKYVGKDINDIKFIVMALVLCFEPLYSLLITLKTVTRFMIFLLCIFYSYSAAA